ncbi:hypothetical protein [Bradyrhizobium sp. CCGUVB14]|uniref:hypothetical protein n=1 Tax=Bradyrhizobium sp. CCGUVB14 TaxID=2949628 RepID=UPI0020B294A4|nr:hypothetical protein [Bradyrhizobium sp. CCGUVB14]MCP3442286.1 hypothetical protein [Bradyrhizobium sp. CCGUVB14]
MSASKFRTHLTIWAGLWFASMIWAVNMQLGQIVPDADCRSPLHISAITSLAGAALTALSGVASWSGAASPAVANAPAHTIEFARAVSALSAGLFTFALAMQGVASLVLTGCER